MSWVVLHACGMELLDGFFLSYYSPGVYVESEGEVPAVVVIEYEHHRVVVLPVEEVLVGEVTVGASLDHEEIGYQVEARHKVLVAGLCAVYLKGRATRGDEARRGHLGYHGTDGGDGA